MKDKLLIGKMDWDEELYSILTGINQPNQHQYDFRQRTLKKLVHIVNVNDEYALELFYSRMAIFNNKK